MLQIRPSVFVVIQVAAYVLRAIISDGHYSIGLFIERFLPIFVLDSALKLTDLILQASEVLLLAGFMLIVEPVFALLV